MPEIRLLDQSTINQIAAGEVIERPASVVKELFENAADAKATAITVEIKDGGITLIRVTDNGCGIDKEQVPLAFKRHATSKIRDIMDLVTVSSLGFRGEALSSVASVAQVEMITKPADKMLGISYQIEDGEEKQIQEIGAPDGTTILVRNLFAHVPARRKFLKSSVTEASHIAQIIENMALSRPELSVRFINNGQTKLYTTGNGRMKDLIYTIYGKEISSNLLEISAQTECFKVTGYLGKPIISRGNRSFENYFINGRFIKSSLISKAIETAYKSFMMQHRYPFTVLHIEIDPELIDVNVHPSKMELRFRREEDIYNQLVRVIEECLRGKQFIPDVRLSDEKEDKKKDEPVKKGAEPFEKLRLQAQKEIIPPPAAKPSVKSEVRTENKSESGSVQKPVQRKLPESGIHRRISPDTLYEKVADEKALKQKLFGEGADQEAPAPVVMDRMEFISKSPEGEAFAAAWNEKHRKTVRPEPEEGKKPAKKQVSEYQQEELNLVVREDLSAPLLSVEAQKYYRVIGQVFDTYWLIQYEDKLYMMDQHAAHEKVLYERLLAVSRKKQRLSQMLSPAIMVTLNPIEEEVLKRYKYLLDDIGYEIEAYGGKEYALCGVPADMYGLDEKQVFIDLLVSLGECQSGEASELIAHKLASMSCKAAIKGNQKISFKEAESLIRQLMTLENPYACPHGRPTLISMSRYELEKKFKRIV